MGFKKGHKIGFHGRQNPAGGRPTYQQSVEKEAKKKARFLAAEMLASYLQDHLKDIADVYIAAAKGGRIPGTKKALALDLATTRHYIDKFAPHAPKKKDLGLAETMEDFVGQVLSGAFYEGMEEAEMVGVLGIADKSQEKEPKDGQS